MPKSWFERKSESRHQRQLFEEERAVLRATEEILRLMEKESISKAELARMLGKTKAYVTQALSGGRNMTLRTLAAFAWACGYSIRGLDLQRIEVPDVTLQAVVSAPRLRWRELQVVRASAEFETQTQDLQLAA